MGESKLFVIKKKIETLMKGLRVPSVRKVKESGLKLLLMKPSEKEKKRGIKRDVIPFGEYACRRNSKRVKFRKSDGLWWSRDDCGMVWWKSKEKVLEEILSDRRSRRDATGEYIPIWKSFLPEVQREKKKLKSIWLRSRTESIPKYSRGFKDDSGEEQEVESKIQKQLPKTTLEKDYHVVEKDFKCNIRNTNEAIEEELSSFCNYGEGEKMTYLSKGMVDLNVIQHKKLTKQTESEKPDMPPRQRCRLSCPLPPAEFNQSQYRAEYLYNDQPHNSVNAFTSSRALFPQKSDEDENKFYKLRSERSTGDLPERKSRVSKTFSTNLASPKSQFLQPPTGNSPKMKALLFEPDSLTLNYRIVDAPTKIHKDEVLVQVTYSGVCGTDLFMTEGKIPCEIGPLILGHEISGKAYAVGSDVGDVKKEDKVVVNPYNACCMCRYCTRGLFSCCSNEGPNNSIGIAKHGGWAEYVTVKKTQIYKVPTELGLDQAVLMHPLSCVLSALYKLNVTPEMDILIQGLGLLGCLWASVFHAQGHRNIFVSEKSQKKKEQFHALNTGYVFIDPEDIGKHKADVVIECTGSPASTEKCLKILNPNGQLCLFGKPNPLSEIRFMPYDLLQKEIKIIGSIGNAFCFPKAFSLATTMGHRYLDFDKLGVRVFDLESYKEAFQMKKSGELSKIMFKF